MSYHSNVLREIGLLITKNSYDPIVQMYKSIMENSANHIDELERRISSDTVMMARFWDDKYNQIDKQKNKDNLSKLKWSWDEMSIGKMPQDGSHLTVKMFKRPSGIAREDWINFASKIVEELNGTL